MVERGAIGWASKRGVFVSVEALVLLSFSLSPALSTSPPFRFGYGGTHTHAYPGQTEGGERMRTEGREGEGATTEPPLAMSQAARVRAAICI